MTLRVIFCRDASTQARQKYPRKPPRRSSATAASEVQTCLLVRDIVPTLRRP